MVVAWSDSVSRICACASLSERLIAFERSSSVARMRSWAEARPPSMRAAASLVSASIRAAASPVNVSRRSLLRVSVEESAAACSPSERSSLS